MNADILGKAVQYTARHAAGKIPVSFFLSGCIQLTADNRHWN